MDDVHQSTFVSDWKSLIRKKFKSGVSCKGFFFLSAVYNLVLYSKILKTHFEIQTIPAQKLVCVNHFFQLSVIITSLGDKFDICPFNC